MSESTGSDSGGLQEAYQANPGKLRDEWAMRNRHENPQPQIVKTCIIVMGKGSYEEPHQLAVLHLLHIFQQPEEEEGGGGRGSRLWEACYIETEKEREELITGIS